MLYRVKIVTIETSKSVFLIVFLKGCNEVPLYTRAAVHAQQGRGP